MNANIGIFLTFQVVPIPNIWNIVISIWTLLHSIQFNFIDLSR